MRGAALALILLAVACGGGSEAPEETATEESVETHAVRGRFLGPAFDGEAMQVAHEEIPGVMEAMTMSFRLADPADIDGLEAGTPIAFDWVVEGLSSQVTNLKLLPADTELKLESP